jgi:uncharacterized membrane protein YphA (DoxX/SURF4 family)
MTSAYWALRIGFGATAFLAGLDKYFNLLAKWESYASPLITGFISAETLMRIVGVIEMAAGIIVLAGLTRIGGYIIAAWLTLIAFSLIISGRYFDVAVRDLVMAAGAFTLARISELRLSSSSPAAASV